jgi:hypothetical protein
MAVNALVTGLIVFKILKVFLEFEATTASNERTSGLGSTKLRRVVFVIIESAIALFVIQLVRLVLSIHISLARPGQSSAVPLYLVIGIAQMLIVIIRSVHFLLLLFY